MKTLESTPADKSTASQSTKHRAIRRTTRQVLTQVTDLIFPLVDFGRADNATYDRDVYLGAECLMSLNGLAAQQGMEIYSDLVADRAGRRPKPDAAAATTEGERDTDDVTDTDDHPETPTGDAHLRTIQLLDRDDIRDLVTRALA